MDGPDGVQKDPPKKEKKMSWFQSFSMGGGQTIFLFGLLLSSLIYSSVLSYVYLLAGFYCINQIQNYE